MLKHFSKQRGQALVFYALFMPLILLFVGVGLDLGWYYLNVSRLQNAADAAALAGAQALVEENKAFEDYYVFSLASNNLPADFDNYEDIFSNKYNFGVLNYYKTTDEIEETLFDGRAAAEEYVRKNLSDFEAVGTSADNQYAVSAKDGWNISSKAADKKVSGTIELKFKIIDAKNDIYGPLYYVVSLNEKVKHFFLSGWFDDMDAPVKAVVLLEPHDKDFIVSMQRLERTKIIGNWEYQDKFKGTAGFYSGNWNHYQAGTRNDHKKGVRYVSGDPNRTESVIVKTTEADSDGASTTANGGTFFSADKVDSINIDFRAETIKNFESDWDLGQALEGQSYEFNGESGYSWGEGNGDDKRIRFNAEFSDAFPTRHPEEEADVLWTRIESDPILSLAYVGKPNHNRYNSVRQITLNFNVDNTEKYPESSEYAGNYKYRPYCIFYTGPENIDYATDSNGVLLRHSQTVVVNLNSDTNAVMYFPESPVVLNGNNKTLHGFIIAKCFLETVTDSDMTNGGSFRFYDGFNAPKTYIGNYTEGTDGNGNDVYFKPDDMVSRSQIDSKYPEDGDATITEDNAGNLLVREEIKATRYMLLEYTKDDHNTYLVEEDGKVNENKTFAAYVNATYKEKFKTFHKLTDDSKITAVTFPNEDYNETTATYYVITGEWEDSPKDDYVKVLVGNSPKYVAKSQLPYVKVRVNHDYFYVCVGDLRLPTSSSNVKGTRMIDNSYTDEQLESSFKQVGNVTSTDADIYINDTSINQYGDSWKIPKTAVYNKWKDWKKDMLEFGKQSGIKYFMTKKEIAALPKEPQVIAGYHKIIFEQNGEEVIKYIKTGDKLYYTKVFNNATNHNNYLIVDDTGNPLTKPITAPEVLGTDNAESNNALTAQIENSSSSLELSKYWNTYTRYPNGTPYTSNVNDTPKEIPKDEGQIIDGKYVGKSKNRLHKDYRIPVLERVYKKEVFKLKADSHYSFFQIPELVRVNYLYLNVNENRHTVHGEDSDDWAVGDMFFTTRRASWVD